MPDVLDIVIITTSYFVSAASVAKGQESQQKFYISGILSSFPYLKMFGSFTLKPVFREYPVSDCAFKFLNEYADHPVYSVRAVNPDLYRKIKNLKKIQTLRIKASHMWQYIRLCRAAETTITPHGM